MTPLHYDLHDQTVLTVSDAVFTRSITPAVVAVEKGLIGRGWEQFTDVVSKVWSDVLPDYGEINDLAVQWAEKNTGRLVAGVSRDQIAAITRAVKAGIERGKTDDQIAYTISRNVGLDDRWARAVEKHHDGLLAQGVPPGKAQALADNYYRKLVRARSLRIAKYEVQKALLAGQRTAWVLADADGVLPDLVRKWVTHPTERTCVRCRSMHGRLSETLSGVYPGGLDLPLHPSCRCTEVLAHPNGRAFGKTNPNHYPAGSSKGGQFAPKKGLGGLSGPAEATTDGPTNPSAKRERAKNPHTSHGLHPKKGVDGPNGKFDEKDERLGRVESSAKDLIESTPELAHLQYSVTNGDKIMGLLGEPPPLNADVITVAHVSALDAYRGSNYMGINKALRDGTRSAYAVDTKNRVRQRIHDMDDAFEKVARPCPATTRAVSLWRAIADDVLPENGERFQDDGFCSTTLDQRVAEGFGSELLRVEVPHGNTVKAMRLSDAWYENEVLFDRGTVFEVVDRAAGIIRVVGNDKTAGNANLKKYGGRVVKKTYEGDAQSTDVDHRGKFVWSPENIRPYSLAKGNPNHYPAGSSRGGEFAPKKGGAAASGAKGKKRPVTTSVHPTYGDAGKATKDMTGAKHKTRWDRVREHVRYWADKTSLKKPKTVTAAEVKKQEEAEARTEEARIARESKGKQLPTRWRNTDFSYLKGAKPPRGYASYDEFIESRKRAQEMVRNQPRPTLKDMANAMFIMHPWYGGRPGGELRGNAKDRAARSARLFKEWGGAKKGYVVCPYCGKKCHNDPAVAARKNYELLDVDKITTLSGGGNYRVGSCFPACAACNRSRGETPIEKTNLRAMPKYMQKTHTKVHRGKGGLPFLAVAPPKRPPADPLKVEDRGKGDVRSGMY